MMETASAEDPSCEAGRLLIGNCHTTGSVQEDTHLPACEDARSLQRDQRSIHALNPAISLVDSGRTLENISLPLPRPQRVFSKHLTLHKTPNPNDAARQAIETVFENVCDALLSEHDEIVITLKTRRNALSSGNDLPFTRSVRFPGVSAEEAWKFVVVVRILELMHEALRNNVILSKRLPIPRLTLGTVQPTDIFRDMFYRDPGLFGSQRHVDRFVDDIAFTFNMVRSSLNITAAAKGLVAGAVTFKRRDGTYINAAADRDGMLVPGLKELSAVEMTRVRWILVVEKEASFRSIAASPFWDSISNEGVLLTGKGYPDLATRVLLRYLCTPTAENDFSSPPVYGLADFDPDGLSILSVYKYGSASLAHENSEISVPRMQWLGLRSDYLIEAAKDSQTAQGLLLLTRRDRIKARRMLERETCLEESGQRGSRAELQTMLMLNMKAELQLLDTSAENMIGLLSSCLKC